MDLPDCIRAFVALRMSAEAETAIERFIEPLRPLSSGVRWVSRTNFHLTLRFLGNEVPTSLIDKLAADLSHIASRAQPFRLTVQGIGGFPNLSRPHVIWIGLQSDELIELATDVRAAASRAGFGDEDHLYTPHLTIARVRDPRELSGLRSVLQAAREHHFGISTIASMALYRSILCPAGAQYAELKSWHLGAA